MGNRITYVSSKQRRKETLRYMFLVLLILLLLNYNVTYLDPTFGEHSSLRASRSVNQKTPLMGVVETTLRIILLH